MLFSSVSAMDNAGAQSAVIEGPERVEDQQPVLAHAAEVAVAGRALLRAKRWTDRVAAAQLLVSVHLVVEENLGRKQQARLPGARGSMNCTGQII